MKIAAIALIVFGLSGCGRGVIKHWEDGKYLVYTRPDSREIIMGHSMGEGAILGLSETTVVSAGSDARHVVFSRKPVSGGVEHYYIEKMPGSEGKVSGPFTPGEYNAIATRLALPAYSWHLK
jgi:hypothetical protein